MNAKALKVFQGPGGWAVTLAVGAVVLHLGYKALAG